MVWVEFTLSAAIITFAAIQLAKYGDVIGIRTRFGGMFIGTILLAAATSLPEVLTTITAVQADDPNLAAGNLFGSNMFNMLMLAVIDLVHYKRRVLRKAANKHALSGSLAALMIALAVFFIVADFSYEMKLGPIIIGIDGMVMMMVYLVAISLLRKQGRAVLNLPPDQETLAGLPSLKSSILWFIAATVILVLVTPWMVDASRRIADITGLGTTFIGATLVAVVTSLPEVVTTISAVKMGADDLAIGNLFGSNTFNMVSLSFADLFYTSGSFFGVIDHSFIIVGLLGLIMTIFGLIGNLAKLEKRFLFIELDALTLILLYIGGLVLLFFRGIGV